MKINRFQDTPNVKPCVSFPNLYDKWRLRPWLGIWKGLPEYNVVPSSYITLRNIPKP